MNELQFESELIQYLCNGAITQPTDTGWGAVGEPAVDYVVKTKLWKYEPGIKTTEQLWDNFKRILEQHNQATLDHPLSVVEFNQVKKIISDLQTPYQAGQFLYGLNGISQIEIDLDDGRHAFLTVFDQKQIGAGDTVYQVVNQVTRPPKIPGKQERIFDTTLLINGLPVIQIEEKRDTRDVDEALNQMHQYIDENQYSDIFSTLQILVAITPNNVKYMANTTAERFNRDFAFHWQRKSDNRVVRNWKEFADSMLSIPMAHQMATNFMILDGTPNKQSVKVMRPYQVYATQRAIGAIKHADFDCPIDGRKLGYIWHTTGSGKTITSFKTAWLASRLPGVDKVVFLVDRIALTKQTLENYRAYDPDAADIATGSIRETQNTGFLSRELKSKGNDIIVTSVQKLERLVKRKSFTDPGKHIVFIVDEAHRSTGGEAFKEIQNAFKHAVWLGYTGTPMFDETTTGMRTEDIFGPLLHAYTIREAIADRNVLGFQVDFETTIPEQAMKEEYLPRFYREQHPDWTREQIKRKIANLTPEDMDDAIEPSFYDENPDHVREVVRDIFDNWRNRSAEGRYNALLTTHVGGGKASTPMAMMYFREFQRVNKERRAEGMPTLKVAVTFSQNTTNNDTMLETNRGLHEAIVTYNEEFGTTFGMDDVSGYTQDVMARLNKSLREGPYLDLVIVVDQLLTGFDAPELNTLYVDRTLKGAGLIQAYSRTNRIADMQEKPWGHVVNYRWPAQNERLMNEALAIYANKDSANLTDEERRQLNVDEGITAPDFEQVFQQVKEKVAKLHDLTDGFTQLPPSEKQQDFMLDLLRECNAGMAKLKQFKPEEVDGAKIGFDYDRPDELVRALGMEPEQEIALTTVLSNELKGRIANKKSVPVYQIELRMTHVKEVKVDYDYLTELIETLINAVHEGETDKVVETRGKIEQFANGLDDRGYAKRILNAVSAIVSRIFPPRNSGLTFPVKLTSQAEGESIIQAASNAGVDRELLEFRNAWGITDFITSAEIRELFSGHRFGQQDLDDAGRITKIVADATGAYKTMATDEAVQALTRIKYRNGLRKAIYDMADKLLEG